MKRSCKRWAGVTISVVEVYLSCWQISTGVLQEPGKQLKSGDGEDQEDKN